VSQLPPRGDATEADMGTLLAEGQASSACAMKRKKERLIAQDQFGASLLYEVKVIGGAMVALFTSGLFGVFMVTSIGLLIWGFVQAVSIDTPSASRDNTSQPSTASRESPRDRCARIAGASNYARLEALARQEALADRQIEIFAACMNGGY